MGEFKKLMKELLEQCRAEVGKAHNTVGSLAYDYMYKKNTKAMEASDHLQKAFQCLMEIDIEDFLKKEEGKK